MSMRRRGWSRVRGWRLALLGWIMLTMGRMWLVSIGHWGEDTVNGFYPVDHTHTSPEGGQVVADAFLKAVVCGDVALKEVLNTTDFDGECL